MFSQVIAKNIGDVMRYSVVSQCCILTLFCINDTPTHYSSFTVDWVI